MNESHRVPTLDLNIARAYLAAHDPKMAPSYLGFVWRIGTYLPTLMIPRPFRASVGPGHKPKCTKARASVKMANGLPASGLRVKTSS
jgi:hypothetical protein